MHDLGLNINNVCIKRSYQNSTNHFDLICHHCLTKKQKTKRPKTPRPTLTTRRPETPLLSPYSRRTGQIAMARRRQPSHPFRWQAMLTKRGSTACRRQQCEGSHEGERLTISDCPTTKRLTPDANRRCRTSNVLHDEAVSLLAETKKTNLRTVELRTRRKANK